MIELCCDLWSEQDLSNLLNLLIGISTSDELVKAAESIKKARNECAHATNAVLEVKTYITSIRKFSKSLMSNSNPSVWERGSDNDATIEKNALLQNMENVLEEHIKLLEESVESNEVTSLLMEEI